MKLSLVAASASALSLLALVAVGCNDDAKLAAPAAPVVEVANPTAAPRKLIEGRALPTSAVNLLADPGFGLVGQDTGSGSFLAFETETFDAITLEATVDSRSPAGFGGAVGLLKATDATDKVSEPAMLLASFQGGQGPYSVKVWVSKSNLAGMPVDLTIDTKGLRATVTDETPDGEAFDLVPAADGGSRVIGGRTWTLLRGEITKPLTYGGFFIVYSGTGGGQFHIAAPEVVAQPLLAGLTTRSTSVALASRPKTTVERTAIVRYKSRPPRLVPAARHLRGE